MKINLNMYIKIAIIKIIIKETSKKALNVKENYDHYIYLKAHFVKPLHILIAI